VIDHRMLISRAPVRISFGGGGTDLPSFYEKYGGMVVSTSINHYVYAILTTGSGDAVQIVSADYRTFWRQSLDSLIWDGDLALPRAIVHEFDLHQGLDIFMASQIPPGTGLGSSGSVAVCLINGLAAWQGVPLTRHEVAEKACYIEIEKMGMPVGKQDQYASAFGGLNCITFTADGVTVEPLQLSEMAWQTLQRRIMLFFTGSSRQSSNILRYQKQKGEEGDERVIERLLAIKELGLAIREALEAGDLDSFGELMHRSWVQKRSLAPNISNDSIDGVYNLARSRGAMGGKITGAGGGGFLMLYCQEEYQDAVTEALEDAGLRRMGFGFDTYGAQVMQAGQSLWMAAPSLHDAFQMAEIPR
jgi:D-glycero-alpha-D-manno-heptose-7-phosphate kinase